ncbi:MAG: InlB B-repeat-containing protein [Deltaproteobacteria bacterium]|nr:InlB B-repeat-containing protein [Deltaproteobacteria bacterium]
MKKRIDCLKSLMFLVFVLMIIGFKFIIMPDNAYCQSYTSVHTGGFIKAHNLPPVNQMTENNTPGSLHVYLTSISTRNYRAFVPPGAKGVTLVFFAPVSSSFGVVARYGFPPQCSGYDSLTSASPSFSCYTGFPWAPATEEGARFARLTEADYAAKNKGGHVDILYDNTEQVGERGRWLYFKLLFNSTNVQVDYDIIIGNKERFRAWYNEYGSADPDFGFVSPPEAPPCTFSSTGDCSGSGGTDPIPVYDEKEKEYCEMFGGLWYDGKCIATEKDCNNVGGTWTNGKCTVGGTTPTGNTFNIFVYKEGSGTVTPAGAQVSVESGKSQSFTFAPASGWDVKKVTVSADNNIENAEDLGKRYNYEFVNVKRDYGLTVVFENAGGSDPASYTVSYNANGATSGNVPASQTKTHDAALTLRTNTGSLAKTGFTLTGWNTNSAGTGTNFALGGVYNTNASVTLYAKWTASGGSSAPGDIKEIVVTHEAFGLKEFLQPNNINIISSADLIAQGWDGSQLIAPKVRLNIEGLVKDGIYECYAAIHISPESFVADGFLDGDNLDIKCLFNKWSSGLPKNFRTRYFNRDDVVWECDAFLSLKGINPTSITSSGGVFIYGIAPVENFWDFKGAAFIFDVD